MKTFATLPDLAAQLGQPPLLSDWLTITQEQVNLFAHATGDHQWIHVDPERARQGPFGGPIAHGFLTLSLIPQFFESSFAVAQSGMGVNYGLNRVRFTAPIEHQGLQMTWEVSVEREGSAKPVCVAEALVRRYP